MCAGGGDGERGPAGLPALFPDLWVYRDLKKKKGSNGLDSIPDIDASLSDKLKGHAFQFLQEFVDGVE